MAIQHSYFTEGVVIDRSADTVYIVEGDEADPSIPFHKIRMFEASDPQGKYSVGDFVSFYADRANNKHKRQALFLEQRW